ncbi:MAG: hypothetical protein WA705_03415 [Candidatus Ozemobacteraceae bacterium]
MSRMKKLMVLALILIGWPVLGMIAHIPVVWVFDGLAIRQAFSAEEASSGKISVVLVSKPSTILFSNGKRVDVGEIPAVVSTIFFVILLLPLMVGYFILLKRFVPKELWERKSKDVS